MREMAKSHRMILAIILAIAFLMKLSVTNSIAEEILVNKNGQSVFLKDDGTWELLPNNGEDGKVVFLVKIGRDFYRIIARKDDFERFTHYDNLVGCKYTITVKNNFRVRPETICV